MVKNISIGFLLLCPLILCAQELNPILKGHVFDSLTNVPLLGALILVDDSLVTTETNQKGQFILHNLTPGWHNVEVQHVGKAKRHVRVKIDLAERPQELIIPMIDESFVLEKVTVVENQKSAGIYRLRQVEGTNIYASKKNELIKIDQLVANKAANSSRQVYAKVSGLNIWESDGAGVQLGIGGRGLSPSRNSNFNTRQNGYDISADALGYPESYYTPPIEALERIEIVRGAASLQYGTQFGGMLNFRFKKGPADKKIELHSRNSVGSYGFFNSYNSVGGTIGKVNYYGFYQYKKNRGWRPNEKLDQHTTYWSSRIKVSDKIEIAPEFTHTNYLAQQPGGLTDAQFKDNPRQSLRKRNWFHVNWNLFALLFDFKANDKLHFNNRIFALKAGRDALGNLDPINLLDFGENRDLLSDRFSNWGNETRMMLKYSTLGQPSTLLVGSRFYRGQTWRRQGDADDGSGPTFNYLNPSNLEGSDFDLPSTNYSLFFENIFSLSEKWSITPGARWEYISTSAQGYYRQINKDLAGNIISDQRFEENKTNRRSFVFVGVGSSFRFSESVEMFVNYSQNYRAINFNDIRVNVGSLVVDENLVDERGSNFDLGLRGSITPSLDFDVSIYHLSYKDRIGTILKREPNPVFNNLVDRFIRFRTNIADASIYGVESLVEWQFFRASLPKGEANMSLFGNVSVTHATYANSAFVDQQGKKVELVPPIIAKSGILIHLNRFSTSVQYSYVGEHFSDASNAVFTPSAIEGLIPSYHILDASMSLKLNKIEIESGINNLLNNQYFTRRATGYPGPGIIPSIGRNFYCTMGFRI
ncbi:MAG: TonB-dependent receptor [Saprospiraceae bacterium]|nr:TonB-dependent receptor [Saprospiraceae bacterium]